MTDMTQQVEMHPQRWGDPAAAAGLPDSARGLIELAFGIAETPAVDPVTVPPSALSDELLDSLRGVLGDVLGHHAGPLAGHQVTQQGRHVRPGAVDRHPGDAGPAGHLRERRAPPAHVEDAVPSGVEVGVPGLPRDGVVTK